MWVTEFQTLKTQKRRLWKEFWYREDVRPHALGNRSAQQSYEDVALYAETSGMRREAKLMLKPEVTSLS